MKHIRRPKRFNSRDFAQAVWLPHKKERQALVKRNYVEAFQSVDQIWPWLALHHGEVLAVEATHSNPPEKFTYAEVSDLISQSAGAFIALGINPGDVVGLFAENSPRWLIADQGLMRVGAADAVRGATAPVEELRYILQDSKAVALVVQNLETWKKLSLSETEKKSLKFILQLEGEPIQGLMGWEQFLATSFGHGKKDKTVKERFDIERSSTATILYTSGTTGRPKGVPLTHANLLHQISSLACVASPKAGSPVLSVLPIWHAYERSAEYYFFSCACTQNYTTIKHLKKDLQRVRPVVMVTVPRLWEAVKAGFDDAIKGMSKGQKKLLTFALGNSAEQKKAWRTSRSLLIEPVGMKIRSLAFIEATLRFPVHLLSSFFLWPKVLRQLSGGRLRFPINGGGAIAPHVDAFFEALGVELLVGYGLTETSPVVSCRRPWRNIRGSSGPPLPSTEFRIVDVESGKKKKYFQIGRVLVRGPQVMKGYLGKPEDTAKVLDDEGWFDTGDLGMLLLDGSLVITGRAKDTIVLSNGENVEPGPLEEFLVSSPLIDQVMLVGQDQRQLGALIVPNFANLEPWASDKGLLMSKELLEIPGGHSLRILVRKEVNRLLSIRKGARSDERVSGVALVDPFTIDNGLLTQTLKQRRDRINNRDESIISFIFDH